MNKQEFLAMSLPYGLKFISKMYEYESMCEFDGLFMPTFIHFKETNKIDHFAPSDSKPILRPLSDLIKEIEHNGEKFIPIDRLNFLYDYTKIGYLYRYTTEYLNEVDWQSEPFEVVKKLIEWKFDIADFISTGEAIDLNTLKINPYK